jgi:hypothetical protein
LPGSFRAKLEFFGAGFHQFAWLLSLDSADKQIEKRLAQQPPSQ